MERHDTDRKATASALPALDFSLVEVIGATGLAQRQIHVRALAYPTIGRHGAVVGLYAHVAGREPAQRDPRGNLHPRSHHELAAAHFQRIAWQQARPGDANPIDKSAQAAGDVGND